MPLSFSTWRSESSSRPNDERIVKYEISRTGTTRTIALTFSWRSATTKSSASEAPAAYVGQC
jgi:hypothetical protein